MHAAACASKPMPDIALSMRAHLFIALDMQLDAKQQACLVKLAHVNAAWERVVDACTC